MAATNKLNVTVNCSGPGNFPLQSKTTFNVIALTAGNFASQNTLINTLAATYNNLTDGIVTGTKVSMDTNPAGGVPSGTANRGQKWILSATNASNRPFTYTIPAAPGSGELQSDNISADLTGTNWVSFKSAFEGVAVDPFGGALTLDAAKLG